MLSAQFSCATVTVGACKPIALSNACTESACASAMPSASALSVSSVSSLPAPITPSISTARSTIASATSPRRPLASAVERISVRMYEVIFSSTAALCSVPSLVIGVTAPMLAPGVIAITSHASAIRAPALIARGCTKAAVRAGCASSASRMRIAASTRPPSVLMSRTTTTASGCAASARSMKADSPRSIVPSIGMRSTLAPRGASTFSSRLALPSCLLRSGW